MAYKCAINNINNVFVTLIDETGSKNTLKILQVNYKILN